MILTTGGNGNEKHDSGQNIIEQPKQNSNTKDLPEFLKQKLKARGILKDEPGLWCKHNMILKKFHEVSKHLIIQQGKIATSGRMSLKINLTKIHPYNKHECLTHLSGILFIVNIQEKDDQQVLHILPQCSMLMKVSLCSQAINKD